MKVQGITKVVSGGQTGVDRAALDAAISAGILVAGWCPAGRRAEDGPIDPDYPLTETPSREYDERTAWNVRDSDGTLILSRSRELSGGTLFTRYCAEQYARPFRIENPGDLLSVAGVSEWLRRHRIRVLNVAGPRDSPDHAIYLEARSYLQTLFAAVRPPGHG